MAEVFVQLPCSEDKHYCKFVLYANEMMQILVDLESKTYDKKTGIDNWRFTDSMKQELNEDKVFDCVDGIPR